MRRRLSKNATFPDPDVVRDCSKAGAWFRSCGARLILYPQPSTLSFESGVPFVMAIHDLQHRLQPEFSEVSAGGEGQRREYLFRNGARYATLLLADSEIGKEDILNCYREFGITADRIKVLPFLPASYLPGYVSENERRQVRETYALPEQYLFYPAQFWPHKNHARIVRALALLKREYELLIPIVLSGSHTNEFREQTFQDVQSLARELDVDNQVNYIGYVPDEHMAGLYAEGTALVMPTFFGPTNIPILEAWSFGCPVVTSDIRGVRDQAGDAAILVDPRSVASIAEGIRSVWVDHALRCNLAERGRQRLAQYTPADFRQRLIEIIDEAKDRIK
jgi:glycosyltransferase involved in cell wall biosynthesis